MDTAQRKSIDTAMRLIRETGTCAVSEEDFAALYAENERLREQRDKARAQRDWAQDAESVATVEANDLRQALKTIAGRHDGHDHECVRCLARRVLDETS